MEYHQIQPTQLIELYNQFIFREIDNGTKSDQLKSKLVELEKEMQKQYYVKTKVQEILNRNKSGLSSIQQIQNSVVVKTRSPSNIQTNAINLHSNTQQTAQSAIQNHQLNYNSNHTNLTNSIQQNHPITQSHLGAIVNNNNGHKYDHIKSTNRSELSEMEALPKEKQLDFILSVFEKNSRLMQPQNNRQQSLNQMDILHLFQQHY